MATKGNRKGFKNEELKPRERVKTAVDNYINASAELQASVKLGYISQEKLTNIIDSTLSKIRINSFAMEIIAILAKKEDYDYGTSEYDSLFSDLT